jgi:ABC-2 type transport system permease protein
LNADRVKALAWKEVLEFIRDRRVIALMALSAFLFPILGLLVAGFKAQQRAPVAILLCDRDRLAEQFARLLAESINASEGLYAVIIRMPTCNLTLGGYIAYVAVPAGFSANATSLDKPVIIKFYKLVGSAAAQDAENVVWNAAWRLSEKLARDRVERLAAKANITVTVNNIIHPVKIVTTAVTATGKPASKRTLALAEAARFLAFSVFFVLNPAAIAVADAIAREREMGTGELIAVTPLTGLEFIVGKAAGALAVSLVAALLDLAGALAYVKLIGFTEAIFLAWFHALQVILAVLVTASITTLITMLIPGRRAAGLVASIVTGLATLIFFSSLFVDFTKLPLEAKLFLYLIPYTYTVEAILSYALNQTVKAAIYTLALSGATLTALAIAAKIYRPDRLVKRYCVLGKRIRA